MIQVASKPYRQPIFSTETFYSKSNPLSPPINSSDLEVLNNNSRQTPLKFPRSELSKINDNFSTAKQQKLNFTQEYPTNKKEYVSNFEQTLENDIPQIPKSSSTFQIKGFNIQSREKINGSYHYDEENLQYSYEFKRSSSTRMNNNTNNNPNENNVRNPTKFSKIITIPIDKSIKINNFVKTEIVDNENFGVKETTTKKTHQEFERLEKKLHELETKILSLKNKRNKNIKEKNDKSKEKEKDFLPTNNENKNGVNFEMLRNVVTQINPHQILPNNVNSDVISDKLQSNRTKLQQSSLNKLVIEKNKKYPVYYISQVIKAFVDPNIKKEKNCWTEHFIQTMQGIAFSKCLNPPSPTILAQKKVYLKQKDFYRNKKTIVFDLDETLIHCNEGPEVPSDIVLQVPFPNGVTLSAGINVRPQARETLMLLSKYFELIIFTASHSCYANAVVNYLDPENLFIQHTLSREDCICTNEGIFIKDLRILGNRNLNNVLIVDNAAYSFGFQIENGIPILPFYNNKNDEELKSLSNYLMKFVEIDNIKEKNADIFKLDKYGFFNDANSLIKGLYEEHC